MSLQEVISILRANTESLSFSEPVTHVYAPLAYASQPVSNYVDRFAASGIEALFLGMNPGPWGMAQTGIPFGEVAHVREFLGITGEINRPENEHPKRPVTGFECARSEVSGRRFWEWVQDRFTTPEAFFDRFFVWNWCPLAFLEASGRNRTPDKLVAEERRPLEVMKPYVVWWRHSSPAASSASEHTPASGPTSHLMTLRFRLTAFFIQVRRHLRPTEVGRHRLKLSSNLSG